MTRICKICGRTKPIDEFTVAGRGILYTCRLCYNLQAVERYRVKSAENRRLYGSSLPPSQLARITKYHANLRCQAVALYGGKCECCGESTPKFLTFDHIHGNPKGRSGTKIVPEALSLGYPNDKYRLLCRNCNDSIGSFGYCPHKGRPEVKLNYYTKSRRKLKLEMIAAYGGKCVLCGETNWEFLSIDHVGGGGKQHRKSIDRYTDTLYRWLRDRGYPQGEYRLLCHNCNGAKGKSATTTVYSE